MKKEKIQGLQKACFGENSSRKTLGYKGVSDMKNALKILLACDKTSVNISIDNSKTGENIPTVNLPAGYTCNQGTPCLRNENDKIVCYALHGTGLYNSVVTSHFENWALFTRDSGAFFNSISDYLSKHDYKYFRWHSYGDIPNMAYLYGMCTLALRHPDINFLCFTKKFDLVNNYILDGDIIPSNLNIVFSAFGKKWAEPFEKNMYSLPMSNIIEYDKNGEFHLFKYGMFVCPADCKTCRRCWHLKKNQTIYFNVH